MNWFKKKPATGLSRREALLCRPFKNEFAVETRQPDGAVFLAYPLPVSPWAAALADRFFKSNGQRPINKKLELDEMGTAVWDLIDGQRTVKEICLDFGAKYQLHPKESETSVTQFIRNLGGRGLIGLK